MKRMIRRGLPVLAASMAVAGAMAVTVPASAATEYHATLKITMARGDAVLLFTNGAYTCYSGFVSGQEISLTATPGQYVKVAATLSCYSTLATGDATITSDGQRVEFDLK